MAVQRWIAHDGTQFSTQSQAEEHENKTNFVNWVKEENRKYQAQHKVQMPPGTMALLIWENWDVEVQLIREYASNGENSSS